MEKLHPLAAEAGDMAVLGATKMDQTQEPAMSSLPTDPAMVQSSTGIDVFESEPNGTISGADNIGVGDLYHASTDGGNALDVVEIQLKGGQSYELYVEQLYTSVIAWIKDASGNQYEFGPKVGWNEDHIFTPPTDGTYYIAFKASQYYSPSYPDYTFQVFEIHDDEPTGTTSTAATVSVDGPGFDGRIDYDGDIDVIAVHLEANSRYEIAVTKDSRYLSHDQAPLGNPNIADVAGPDGQSLGFSYTPGGTNNPVQTYFTSQQAGTYYFYVGAATHDIGRYNFSVTTQSDDEPFGDQHTHALLQVGGSVTVTSDYNQDKDAYAVQLTAGTKYVFSSVRAEDGSPLPDLQLLGRDGTPIYQDVGHSEDSIYYTPTASGTYYVVGQNSGTYRISAAVSRDDEPYGSILSTRHATVGAGYHGDFEVQSDTDTIAVQLTAGTQYRFDLEGASTHDGTADYLYIKGLQDADGNEISTSPWGLITANAAGNNAVTFYTPQTSGTYYVTVSGHQDSWPNTANTGTYTLTVSQTVDDEPTASVATQAVGAVGQTYTGSIDFFGDEDMIAIPVVAGQVYQLDTAAVGASSANLYQPNLYDGNMNPIHFGSLGNSTGDLTGIRFTVPEDMTIYVKMFTWSSRTVGDYTVNVSTVVDDEPTGSVATAQSFAPGETYHGQLEAPSDQDYVGIQLEAGTAYKFLMAGEDTGAETGVLWRGNISGVYDGDGNQLESVQLEDYGSGAVAYFTPSTTGTYYLDLTSNDYWTGMGSYSVTATAIQDDEPYGSLATQTAVTFGHTVSGTIDYQQDRDYYAFATQAGIRYSIVYEAHLGINPSMGVWDDGGEKQYLQYQSGVGGAYTYAFTAVTGGTYYLGIQGSYDYTGDYSFSIAREVRTTGTQYSEQLQGGDGADDIAAGNGNDIVYGFKGNDKVSGDAGDDTIYGGAGMDTLSGNAGGDVIDGGDGDDAIWAGKGDDSADRFAGGDGNDQIGGGAGNDLIFGDNFVSGTVGDTGRDSLFGGDGDDILVSGSWNDANANGIFEDGEEVVSGTAANQIWAGADNDTVYGANGAETLGGGDGADHIAAAGGNDLIFGGRDAGGDTIEGGSGSDTVYAGQGDDSLLGGVGQDQLYGGSGADTIDGGDGNDEIYGGAGNDVLTGGAGADTFYFAHNHGDDTVRDFSVTEDTLFIQNTNTNFATVSDVTAASQEITIDGEAGLLIDTGNGASIFLVGIGLSDLGDMTIVL